MKARTKEEIIAKVNEIWATPEDYYKLPTVKVEIRMDAVLITISRMYEAPGLNLAKLKALAEFFETDNINDDGRFSYGGCETCDYGSSYGFTLTVRA